MHEALKLFEALVNSLTHLNRCMFFLLFTKADLLQDKLSSGFRPVNDLFPEYDGPPKDPIAVFHFFASKFRSLAEARGRELLIYNTNTRDTDSVREVLDSVHSMIVQRNLYKTLWPGD